MKTLIYVILLILVLAGLAAGIYYLVTQVDYSGITDGVDEAVDWMSGKVDSIKGLFD